MREHSVSKKECGCNKTPKCSPKYLPSSRVVDSRSLSFFFFDCEGAVLETGLLGQSGADVGKATDLFRMLRTGVAVEEASKSE